jgi:hypothetical protein
LADGHGHGIGIRFAPILAQARLPISREVQPL